LWDSCERISVFCLLLFLQGARAHPRRGGRFLIFYKVYINFASLKVVYLNPKAKKATILKENKGKSGVYL
jgi:hypothetical protein